MQKPLGKILLRKGYSYDLKTVLWRLLNKAKGIKLPGKTLAGTRFGALQYDAMSKTFSSVLLKYV